MNRTVFDPRTSYLAILECVFFADLRRVLNRSAVTLDITQMRVHRLGADELPAARRSALRVELYDAGCPRTRTRTAPVPAPCAPILERQRRCGASAARVEPATSFPGVRSPVRVAACSPDRLMDFTDKAGRTPTYRPDPARARIVSNECGSEEVRRPSCERRSARNVLGYWYPTSRNRRQRQAELAKQFEATTNGVRAARAERLNGLRRGLRVMIVMEWLLVAHSGQNRSRFNSARRRV